FLFVAPCIVSLIAKWLAIYQLPGFFPIKLAIWAVFKSLRVVVNQILVQPHWRSHEQLIKNQKLRLNSGLKHIYADKLV
ncbi:hypothetical protein, partial [Catenovulum sediminis]